VVYQQESVLEVYEGEGPLGSALVQVVLAHLKSKWHNIFQMKSIVKLPVNLGILNIKLKKTSHFPMHTTRLTHLKPPDYIILTILYKEYKP
jgi:hypothetical protein